MLELRYARKYRGKGGVLLLEAGGGDAWSLVRVQYFNIPGREKKNSFNTEEGKKCSEL